MYFTRIPAHPPNLFKFLFAFYLTIFYCKSYITLLLICKILMYIVLNTHVEILSIFHFILLNKFVPTRQYHFILKSLSNQNACNTGPYYFLFQLFHLNHFFFRSYLLFFFFASSVVFFFKKRKLYLCSKDCGIILPVR